ncbi:TetR family transcriptional regulator C-terminal domain-containing protein [Nocardia sp. 004]|uniref:TetR family transcriptional regulator C-terminal domain-containing protein n=1 Tax=Nocardia sp. 004 TaxID=3385978 RepID=UPI0039A28E65
MVLVERWFGQVAEPLFSGGCFRVATLAEFDSKPGPVREAIAEDRRNWLALLAAEIRRAQEQGHMGQGGAEIVAFELDAVIAAAHSARQCGDDAGVATARTIVDGLLGRTAPGSVPR